MTETVLYFDCFSGIAGDMTLGALIDLGIDVDELEAALRTLPLENWRLDVQRRVQNGLVGTDVHIWVNGDKEGPAVTDGPGAGRKGMAMNPSMRTISTPIMTRVSITTTRIVTTRRLSTSSKGGLCRRLSLKER